MIAWLPHSTNPVYAGTRIRCLTPLRHLQQRGLNVALFEISRVKDYQTVIIQGLRCHPSSMDHLTGAGLLNCVRKLRQQGCKIIVEDCDNHFYNPQNLSEWAETSNNLRELLNLADHLVASTSSIAELFRRESNSNTPISIIGDGVETDQDLNFEVPWRRFLNWRRKKEWLRYYGLRSAISKEKRSGITQLVWFGSHGSSYADGGMRDLQNIQPLLEKLSAQHTFSLTVISNSRTHYEKLVAPMALRTRYFDWSRVTFLAALAMHDIALVPIARTPFTLCKSNNRLLLSLNQGLAVCADSIPSYSDFAHVCSLDNWAQGLSAYLESGTLRRAHVEAAKPLIQQNWSAEVIATQWQNLLESFT